LEQTAVEVAHLDEIQQELRNAVYEASTAKVEANAGLESVNDAIRRLTEERPLIAGEVAQIEQQIAETKQRAAQSANSAGELEAINAQREQAIAGYNQRIEALSIERDRTQHKLTEARVAVAKLAEKRAATAETINQLRHAIRLADESIAAADREREEAQARVTDSEEAVLTAREQLESLGAQADRLEAAGVQLRRKSELAKLEGEQLAAQTKQHRTRLEDLESRLHQIHLEMQEATVRRDNLTTRVRDELKLDLVNLYDSYDHGEQDWEAVEAEINDLRQKIERLGHVNLDAIDEQAELEQRDEFLSSQRQDLENARKELESLIKKLDDESIERFTRTFEAIRHNFRDLFRKLFGGGKADIVLEDPNDVLESGVEILAKPPGKELQRISLMSGGEKTMTAIALVMSIFRGHPAPFAILDEVDAALDEANNVRFNTIVREFLDRSQFIIVTHSKRTMSIADQLYGVTMQEPGVSARVSVKFEQESGTDRSAVA